LKGGRFCRGEDAAAQGAAAVLGFPAISSTGTKFVIIDLVPPRAALGALDERSRASRGIV